MLIFVDQTCIPMDSFSKLFNHNRSIFIILVLLFISILAAYFPIFNNHFLKSWDDNRYIIDNSFIQVLSFSSVGEMFSMYFDGHYHPLTLLSLAIDFQIDGLNPAVFHTTNLVIHIVNTFLVFWFVHLLFEKKKIIIAIVAAFLFGLSVMGVESVVWASERKNLLFSFFFFAALLSYLQYLRIGNYKFFIISIIFFLFSLLSKAMAIPLVASLIAIDYFYGRKIFDKRVIIEKIPFLILAVVFAVVAIYAQKSTWGEDLGQVEYSYFHRFLFAGTAFVQYLFRLIIPYKLSGFYPYPSEISGVFLWIVFASFVCIAALFWLFFYYSRRDRIIAFSLLFYSVNIFLLLKIFEFPAGDYIMADRYSYIASVGIYILVAYLFQRLLEKKFLLIKVAPVILVGYLILVGLHTNKRVIVFKDDLHFYTDIISKYPSVEVAYTNRGVIRQKKHNFRGALSDFNNAIRLNPKGFKNFANRAAVYSQLDNYPKAKADYQKAHLFKPDNLMILSNLGFSKLQTGDYQGAIQDLSIVIEKQANNTDAINNRGTARFSTGNFEGAILDYELAIRIDSNFQNAWFNKALANLNLNRLNEAILDFSICIKINPDHAESYSNRAIAYSRQYNFEEALFDYNKAIQLKPSFFDVWLNRGVDLLHIGKKSEAISDFNQAIQINPNVGASYYFRGLALVDADGANACDDFRMALKLGFRQAQEQINQFCN